jgi:two-component sensor histidine kinase
MFSHFEEIAKLQVKVTDTLDDVLVRLGEKLCSCLHVERVNIWVFKNNPSRLECIGNVDRKQKTFSKGEILTETQIPTYFSHLASDQTIKIKNVYTSMVSAELKDTYCVDHHIFSIMDIPVRIEGILAGVICFEDCKAERNWTDDEENFALAVSQIVSLSIENEKRKKLQKKLEKALEEKNTLFVEMHHRLKNNLTMLVSLLRLQTRNISEIKTQEVLQNFEKQILSISKLHEQLYVSENFLKVNLKHYFNELLNNFKDVISGEEQINSKLEDVLIDAQYAVTIGLIVNEILNNAIKYGRVDKRNLEINCSLNSKNGFIHFMISDNGPGFELEKQKSNSFGLSLIDDLTEQLNATIDFDSSSNGTCYSFQFQN